MPALLAALAAAGLALGTATSADAERWTGADAVGDVTGAVWDPEPAPCGTATPVDPSGATDADLTGVRVRHQHRDLTVDLDVADLRESGHDFMTVHLRTAKGAWAVDLDRFGRRDFGGFFYAEPDWDALIQQADPDGDGCEIVMVTITEEQCKGLDHHGDPESNVVEVSIPRSCLGRPHWVRVAASSNTWRKSDGAFFDDRWGPDGVEPTSVVGPFGPRVKAGPVASTQPAVAGRGSGRASGRVRQLLVTVTPQGVSVVPAPGPTG